jgi:hypothetical protein
VVCSKSLRQEEVFNGKKGEIDFVTKFIGLRVDITSWVEVSLLGKRSVQNILCELLQS